MMVLMEKTLIIGYGNLDRQDDGVAYHILTSIAQQLNRGISDLEESLSNLENGDPAFFFSLQLTPETAEIAAGFDRLCFVDCHTGSVDEDLHMEKVAAEYQRSPLTHHMTAQTCMALVEQVYHKKPEAILVSVRGYQFEFVRGLSEKTAILADQAAQEVVRWYRHEPVANYL